jgi:CRP-like cAMP-binding protein
MRVEHEQTGRVALILRLRRFPLFHQVSLESLAALAQSARVEHFVDGEPVARAGEAWSGLHLAIDGAFTAPIPDADEDPDRAELIGALSLLSERPLPCAVTARGATRALCLPADVLFEVLEDDFSTLLEVLRAVGRLVLSAPVHTGGLPPEPPPRTGLPTLDLVERMFFIQRAFRLTHSSVTSLAETARSAVQVPCDGSRPLWRAGDAPGEMVVVAAGAVTLQLADGRTLRVGRYGVLGGIDVLTGSPRRYDAWPEPGSVVLWLPAETTMNSFEDHFHVAMGLLAVLSQDALPAFFRPRAQEEAA